MQRKDVSKVYIIIVTFNGMKWLPICLRSATEYNVIIVDNASEDGTQEFIKKNYPGIVLLVQKENLGFGKANNIGMEAAWRKGADFVFLLNQDAYLQKDCIESLIEIHQKNKDYGILSPVHLNGKGDRLDRLFSIYLGYDGNKDFYSDCLLGKPQQEVYQVPFVNAAGWLISKECMENVGGFDPMFEHYGEDENYCQRVIFKGFKIGVVPGAYIFHDREERENPKVNKGEKAHFRRMEKELKIEFGDVNQNFDNKLDEILQRRKLSKIKSYLKFNLHDADYYNKEVAMLKRITPQIKKSREINSNLKAAHLKLQ